MSEWGISKRILSLAIIPTFIVAILLGIFFINNYINSNQESFVVRGNTIAGHLALSSEYPMITLEQSRLQEISQVARDNDKDILAVAIYDSNNRILSSVGPTESLKALALESPQELVAQFNSKNIFRSVKISNFENRKQFYAPVITKINDGKEPWQYRVKKKDTFLGYVAVVMTGEFTTIGRYKTIITTIIIGIIGLIIGGFLALRMASSVTDPITKMAAGVNRIKDGHLDTRINSSANSELKILQNGINLMAENMEHNQEELQLAVQQSTEDLRETLETLEINNLELDLARKQAIEASRIKTEFLANMSHEIRTPMNGVIGFTDLLLKTTLTNKQKDFLFDIKRSASNLLSIIDDILDYSKIEAGKMSLERYPFDIRECVDDVFRMLGPNANKKGLELVSLIYSDVPKALYGDPIRIKQIITNLVNNAIKFTKSGSVELYAEIEHEDARGLTMKIQIKDTGIGLSEQQRSSLFKAFNQADTSTKREFGGTGLGLVISKSLIEKMGGKIDVESNKDKGSTFWFTLYCERSESDLIDKSSRSVFLTNKTALVFDPHPATRVSITQMLEDMQMVVNNFSIMEDLSSELELYQQSGKNIELIVIGGQRFRRNHSQLEYICNLANNLNCPVITFSGSTEPEHIKQLRQSGVNRTLTKPVTYRNLYNVLIELLRSTEETQRGETDKSLLKKMKLLKNNYVLAVDDNPANLRLVNILLEDLGIKVDTAESGMQAISLSKDKVYDAILMDIQMPEMDGLEATRTIRANKTNQKTPIIALTAHAMASEREQLLDAGMNDYMTKPVSEKDLVKMLSQWTPGSDSDKESSKQQGSKKNDYQEKTLDWELSLKLSNNNAELAKDMLKMLVDTNFETSKNIHTAYQTQDFEALLYHVHKLHGASCYLGTPMLKALSHQYENKLKTHQYNQVEDLHHLLLEELKKIDQEAKFFIQGSTENIS